MTTTLSDNPQTAEKKSGKLLQGVEGKTPFPATVIKRLQTDFELPRSTVVRISGFSPRSIASWLKGGKATAPVRRKFTELLRLLEALAGLMENPADVAAWLHEPNSAFEGSSPVQIIERGETDRIWRMIYTLESGEPG